MTPSSLRGRGRATASLVAATVGGLLVLALLVLVPGSAATASTQAQDDRCSAQVVAARSASAYERSAANNRVYASNRYAAARDRQRQDPSPRNKQRAKNAYRAWQNAIAEHEEAKKNNQQAKRELRRCRRG